MSPTEKERLVQDLARVIDHDEPPGLAARSLARRVVTLLQRLGRDSKLVAVIESQLDAMERDIAADSG